MLSEHDRRESALIEERLRSDDRRFRRHLPRRPARATILITMDVLIIPALAAHDGEPRT